MILNIIGRDELLHLSSYILGHLELEVGGEVVFEIDGVVGEEDFFVILNE
jgi:hypothetical protein